MFNRKFWSYVVLCAQLCVSCNPQAFAGSPFIWGADSRAQGLQSRGAVFSNGQPIDYDGVVNYISNKTGTINTAGWATYADAAQTTPVNGTGGSPTVTWTRNTSSPIRGSTDFVFTKGVGNLQGQGASYDFTIATADISKTLQISFDVSPSVNYLASNMGVYIYDVTNSTLITPASVNIAQAAYNFQTTFVATTSTSYRLIFHVQDAANTAAYTLNFANIVVGPQLLTLGSQETPWEAFTMSLTGYTGGTVASYMRRSGQNLQITGSVASPTTWSGVLTLTLPNSLTIDSTAIAATGIFQNTVGSASIFDNSAGAIFGGICTIESATTIRFAGALTSGNNWSQTYPVTLQNGSDKFTFEFSVPIAEFAGAGVYMSTAQPEYAWNSSTNNGNDTTSFAYGPFGSQLINLSSSGIAKRVRFLTAIQSTDRIQIQIFNNGQWFDLGETNNIMNYARQGSQEYGMYYLAVSGSTTDIDVQFTGYRLSSNASYAGAGADWSALAASNNYRWRVAKIPGQVQVATPNVTLSQPIAFTPTYTGVPSGSTINTHYYMVRGNSILVWGSVALTATNGNGIQIPLPSGFLVRTSTYPTSSRIPIGNITWSTSAGGDVFYIAPDPTNTGYLVARRASLATDVTYGNTPGGTTTMNIVYEVVVN